MYLRSAVLSIVYRRASRDLLVLSVIRLISRGDSAFLVEVLLNVDGGINDVLLLREFRALVCGFFSEVTIAIVRVIEVPFPRHFSVLMDLALVLVRRVLLLVRFASLSVSAPDRIALRLGDLAQGNGSESNAGYSALSSLLIARVGPLELVGILKRLGLLFLGLSIFHLSSGRDCREVQRPLCIALSLGNSTLDRHYYEYRRRDDYGGRFLRFRLYFVFCVSALAFVRALLCGTFFVPRAP